MSWLILKHMFKRTKKFNKTRVLHRIGKRFIYQRKKYSNPFFQKRKQFFNFNIKIKIYLLISFILFVVLVWFFCFSSVFIIKNIIISGTGVFSAKEIEDIIWQQTEERFGSQKNLILFSKSELFKKLNNNYFLDDLTIKKKFLSTLLINFKVRTPVIIWYESDRYYFIDNEGNVISQVNLLEISKKEYPLIENRGSIIIKDRIINLSRDKIKYILDIFIEFKDKKHNFELDRFIIDDELNTIRMAVLGGPEILFNIKEDLSKQVNKLDTIISSKFKEEFLKKIYIDLRLGDRVYYR